VNLIKVLINNLDVRILSLFAFLEVVLFNSDNSIKFIVSSIEYAFIFFVFFKNMKIGILYFFSFLILTIGFGNYGAFEGSVNNFWGLRFFGISFSIVVLMLFSLILLIRQNFRINLKLDLITLFLFLFTIYGFINGIINVLFENSHLDNFINDTMTYLPVFFYAILISFLKKEDLFLVFKYVFPISVFQVLISAITNNKLFYSDYFVITNCLGLILPISVFFIRKFYSFLLWFAMILIIGYVFYTSQYFISGKLIILVFFIIVMKLINNKRFYFFIVPLIFLFYFLNDLFLLFIDVFSSSKVIVFKFSQIQDLFQNVNFVILAKTPTSIGNLIAECLTSMEYLLQNPLYFIFGKGFGSGVPDIFGYLSPWVYENGYAKIDLTRNDFFRMHLPIFDIFLRGGFFFLLFYFYILFKYVKSINSFSIITLMMFLTIFTLCKEMLLFTLISHKLFEYSRSSNNNVF
jgi:hypothetical protein